MWECSPQSEVHVRRKVIAVGKQEAGAGVWGQGKGLDPAGETEAGRVGGALEAESRPLQDVRLQAGLGERRRAAGSPQHRG